MVQCCNPIATWPRMTLSVLLPTGQQCHSHRKQPKILSDMTRAGCPVTPFPSFYASLYLTNVGEAGSSGSDTPLAWQIPTSPPNNAAGTEHLLCQANACLSMCTLLFPQTISSIWKVAFHLCELISVLTYQGLDQKSLFHTWEEPVPLWTPVILLPVTLRWSHCLPFCPVPRSAVRLASLPVPWK